MNGQEPERPFGWQGQRMRVTSQRRKTSDGPEATAYVRLFIDTPEIRLVGDWHLDELQSLAEHLYRDATGIDIRDAADLAVLSTVAPFED